MASAAKKPTFNFFLHKNGERVNLKELPENEQQEVGVWAYKTILKSLGYEPIENNS